VVVSRLAWWLLSLWDRGGGRGGGCVDVGVGAGGGGCGSGNDGRRRSRRAWSVSAAETVCGPMRERLLRVESQWVPSSECAAVCQPA
jgi:hypothetical protein